jgi:hypothetical protein
MHYTVEDDLVEKEMSRIGLLLKCGLPSLEPMRELPSLPHFHQLAYSTTESALA